MAKKLRWKDLKEGMVIKHKFLLFGKIRVHYGLITSRRTKRVQGFEVIWLRPAVGSFEGRIVKDRLTKGIFIHCSRVEPEKEEEIRKTIIELSI